MHRSFRIAPAVLALAAVFIVTPVPAHAENKDMIELKLRLQQLQDAVARLQQSNDERMGVMKDLVQQTTDSVSKMSLTLDAVQRQVRAQGDTSGGKIDQVSSQMQSLNDSLDELKARLGRMEKSLADVQSSQQSINARMASGAPSTGSPMDTTPPPASTPAPAAPITRPGGKPSAGTPISSLPSNAPSAAAGLPTNPSAPPVEDLYRTAYSDFNSAKYPLATAEFNDVIRFYPDSNLSGNSYFYLGEIDYRAGRFAPAARNYDKVLEQYPGNQKAAVAQLRKGESLISLHQTDAGARELRSLMQRFPNSPEASTARAKLASLGLSTGARR